MLKLQYTKHEVDGVGDGRYEVREYGHPEYRCKILTHIELLSTIRVVEMLGGQIHALNCDPLRVRLPYSNNLTCIQALGSRARSADAPINAAYLEYASPNGSDVDFCRQKLEEAADELEMTALQLREWCG